MLTFKRFAKSFSVLCVFCQIGFSAEQSTPKVLTQLLNTGDLNGWAYPLMHDTDNDALVAIFIDKANGVFKYLAKNNQTEEWESEPRKFELADHLAEAPIPLDRKLDGLLRLKVMQVPGNRMLLVYGDADRAKGYSYLVDLKTRKIITDRLREI